MVLIMVMVVIMVLVVMMMANIYEILAMYHLSHSMDCTLWTVACQAPLSMGFSMGFSRQEYWSGLPRPPGDLPRDQVYISYIYCIGRWVLNQ